MEKIYNLLNTPKPADIFFTIIATLWVVFMIFLICEHINLQKFFKKEAQRRKEAKKDIKETSADLPEVLVKSSPRVVKIYIIKEFWYEDGQRMVMKHQFDTISETVRFCELRKETRENTFFHVEISQEERENINDLADTRIVELINKASEERKEVYLQQKMTRTKLQ